MRDKYRLLVESEDGAALKVLANCVAGDVTTATLRLGAFGWDYLKDRGKRIHHGQTTKVQRLNTDLNAWEDVAAVDDVWPA